MCRRGSTPYWYTSRVHLIQLASYTETVGAPLQPAKVPTQFPSRITFYQGAANYGSQNNYAIFTSPLAVFLCSVHYIHKLLLDLTEKLILEAGMTPLLYFRAKSGDAPSNRDRREENSKLIQEHCAL